MYWGLNYKLKVNLKRFLSSW